MIKLKVREESFFFYGKEKAASRRTEENRLYANLTYLEKKIEEPLPLSWEKNLANSWSRQKKT